MGKKSSISNKAFMYTDSIKTTQTSYKIFNNSQNTSVLYYRINTNNLLKVYSTENKLNKIVIYSCTSGYPIDADQVCLMEIFNLKNIFNDDISDYAFSGHHKGVAIDLAAYTLGTRWIERHFTKDRTWKGTDHAASLEPHGLFKLVRDLNNTYKALQYKSDEVLDIEKPQRKKLKFKN